MTVLAEVLVSSVAIVVFVWLLFKFRIDVVVGRMSSSSLPGLSAMLDSELDDEAKEKAVRKAGISLLTEVYRFVWRILTAVLAATVLIYLAGLLRIAPPNKILALMLSLEYILAVSILGTLAVWLIVRQKSGRERDFDESAYGAGDRFIHMLAFSSNKLQRLIANIEDKVFAHRIDKVPSNPPIFLTSLARGGTTALLNAFHDIPDIATHEYRDMPFITAPVIWSFASGGKRRKVNRRERAHGDGIEIDLDSPEAFDEIFWRLFWPDHYKKFEIQTWQVKDKKNAALQFFQVHFKKIILLRREQRLSIADANIRYLSKNNANVGRLRFLKKEFADCDIVVALRKPAAHAASLFRQHKNFCKQHSKNDFTLRYMRDVGHYEFGLLHRPIAFETFSSKDLLPDEADYWLSYWIAAFREVQFNADNCLIVRQDDLRSNPQVTMLQLADALNVDASGIDFSRHFRSCVDELPQDMFSDKLLSQAEALYESLSQYAIGRHFRKSSASEVEYNLNMSDNYKAPTN